MTDDGDIMLPAWLDPKRRTMIINPDSIICGVLIVGSEFISFVGSEGVIFRVGLDDTKIRWIMRRVAGEFESADKVHRLYFALPAQGAPKLDERTLDSVAEIMNSVDDLREVFSRVFGSSAGDAADVTGLFRTTLGLVQSTISLTTGYRNVARLKSRFSNAS
jgi:hypothetical protein